jgi:hypothetical protein
MLALLVWALVASLVGAYYYYSYNDLFQKTRKPIIHINLGLNYGNGTIQWFNQTEARSGDTLLDITMTVAEVNHTAYSTGAYVTSINKVEETTSKSWTWWTWTKQFGFSAGQVASDPKQPRILQPRRNKLPNKPTLSLFFRTPPLGKGEGAIGVFCLTKTIYATEFKTEINNS